MMFGFQPIHEFMGIAAGHIFYYCEDIVPKLEETYGYRLLKPPRFLEQICQTLKIHDFQINEEDFIADDQNNQEG